MKGSPAIWTWLAAGSLILSGAIGLLSSPAPALFCPKPALLFIPGLFLRPQQSLAILIPPLLFLLWNKNLVRGTRNIPTRTYLLAGFCMVLMPFEFTYYWDAGIQEQGPAYTYTVCIVNTLFCIAVITGLAYFRKARATFAGNLLTHWLLFVWLSWFGFPALGKQL